MKIEDIQGISEPLMERDIVLFLRGRSRIMAIKRWILTRQDALEKEAVADYLVSRIKDYLLDRQNQEL